MRSLLIIAVLAVTACSTTPVPSSLARDVTADNLASSPYATPGDDRGTVIVTRDNGFVGSGCVMRVLMNGTPVALLNTRESVTLHVPAGEHIVGTLRGSGESGAGLCGGSRDSTEVSVTVEPGVTKRLRIGFGSHADTEIGVTTTQ